MKIYNNMNWYNSKIKSIRLFLTFMMIQPLLILSLMGIDSKYFGNDDPVNETMILSIAVIVFLPMILIMIPFFIVPNILSSNVLDTDHSSILFYNWRYPNANDDYFIDRYVQDKFKLSEVYSIGIFRKQLLKTRKINLISLTGKKLKLEDVGWQLNNITLIPYETLDINKDDNIINVNIADGIWRNKIDIKDFDNSINQYNFERQDLGDRLKSIDFLISIIDQTFDNDVVEKWSAMIKSNSNDVNQHIRDIFESINRDYFEDISQIITDNYNQEFIESMKLISDLKKQIPKESNSEGIFKIIHDVYIRIFDIFEITASDKYRYHSDFK